MVAAIVSMIPIYVHALSGVLPMYCLKHLKDFKFRIIIKPFVVKYVIDEKLFGIRFKQKKNDSYF